MWVPYAASRNQVSSALQYELNKNRVIEVRLCLGRGKLCSEDVRFHMTISIEYLYQWLTAHHESVKSSAHRS